MLVTREFTSKRIEMIAFNCSFTFSISFFRISVSKSYLIVNDLSRMFVEKFRSFDLQQHQNHCRFSQNFDFRQLDRLCSISSKKSYFIIENLFEMFDENLERKSLLYSQKSQLENSMNMFFRNIFSHQMRITFYFKFAVNQNAWISQNSKNSKSKSLNQHMFAKSIRTVFSKRLFENSINLSYKMSHVFCTNLKFSVEFFFFIFILFRLFSIFLLVFAFVSIVSVAKMNCISVYQQVISIIDRVNIEFVVSKWNWKSSNIQWQTFL